MILKSNRDLFEIPEDVTYLNCANMAPQLRSITSAGINSVKEKATPWFITPPDWFSRTEELRKVAGQLIHTDAECIAIVSSVSYGVSVAAANVSVRKGQNIVLIEEQYPSNVYAWQDLAQQRSAQIRTAKRHHDGSWTEAILNAMDDDTAVVSVPNCHWTDGSLINLIQIGVKARSVGAALIIDASQSLGAYPLDVSAIKPDFLVSVGYKWQLGPYGLGYLYAAPRWQVDGIPLENSWLSRAGSENFANLVEYVDEYRSGARRFDMGQFPQFVLTPMAITALSQILDWGVDNIQDTITVLTHQIAKRAQELGCFVLPAEQRVGHIVGIRLPSGIPEGLSKRFSSANIYVSIRGDSIRVAPHLYNDENDVDRFFSVLKLFL